MVNAPCKNCSDRHKLCHRDCEEYKEFKRKIKEIRTAEKLDVYPWVEHKIYKFMRERLKRKG